MIWRWDQGRMQYFNFKSIKLMSLVLSKYNGANMEIVDSNFRDDLMSEVGLPFAPQHYTIKRNYKRVFECSMLATYANNRLIISQIGKAIASNDPLLKTVDGYLYEVERRFRYPYPAFNNYKDIKNICYPFISIIKFLLAKAYKEKNACKSITLEEIGQFLIANDVSGLEDFSYYCNLQPKSFSFDSYSSNDHKRQVREMMAFIGQHTYLNYDDSSLSLNNIDLNDCENICKNFVPYKTQIQSSNPVDDFLKITEYTEKNKNFTKINDDEDVVSLKNFIYKEGMKVFKKHFIRERNQSIRKIFIKKNPQPICDICGKNMHVIYPWTNNMLEIHHIYPLSSTEKSMNTSIDDVVGLCPSCHRALHLYYKKYLEEMGKTSFTSTKDAKQIYDEVKNKVSKNA